MSEHIPKELKATLQGIHEENINKMREAYELDNQEVDSEQVLYQVLGALHDLSGLSESDRTKIFRLCMKLRFHALQEGERSSQANK